MSLRLCLKKGPRQNQSPCTKASRMNISLDLTGSIGPKWTRRRGTIGKPYKDTCSKATTCDGFFSQCGSEYCLRTKSPATGSIHSGSIFAAMRAYNRPVSTNSAAIIHFGPFL